MQIEEAIERLKLSKSTFLFGAEQTIVNIEDLDTVLNELEKKDKTMDLMIEEGLHIPENELYKVEKIYKEVKDKTELKGRELKKYCIKEYFTKKVEGE